MFTKITYLNDSFILYYYVNCLQRLDAAGFSSLLINSIFLEYQSVFPVNISLVHLYYSFLQSNFKISGGDGALPFGSLLHLYMLDADPGELAYSYYDIYAQAFYDLFTIHIVACFYLRVFNDQYNSYIFEMTKGHYFYIGDKPLVERIEMFCTEVIKFDGARLFKFHGLPCNSVLSEFTDAQFSAFIFFMIKESNVFPKDFLDVMEGALSVLNISFTVLESPIGGFMGARSLLL